MASRARLPADERGVGVRSFRGAELEGVVSSREFGDASACILANGTESSRQGSEMDATTDEARDTAIVKHLDRGLLLLWSKGRMEFCTQSVELNEVILGANWYTALLCSVVNWIFSTAFQLPLLLPISVVQDLPPRSSRPIDST
jgi:hypothetical protein